MDDICGCASVTISCTSTPWAWRDAIDLLNPSASMIPDFNWHSLLSMISMASIFLSAWFMTVYVQYFAEWPGESMRPSPVTFTKKYNECKLWSLKLFHQFLSWLNITHLTLPNLLPCAPPQQNIWDYPNTSQQQVPHIWSVFESEFLLLGNLMTGTLQIEQSLWNYFLTLLLLTMLGSFPGIFHWVVGAERSNDIHRDLQHISEKE